MDNANPNKQLKSRLDERRKYSYCSACDAEMATGHILICADCLNDECERFASFYEKEDEINE